MAIKTLCTSVTSTRRMVNDLYLIELGVSILSEFARCCMMRQCANGVMTA